MGILAWIAVSAYTFGYLAWLGFEIGVRKAKGMVLWAAPIACLLWPIDMLQIIWALFIHIGGLIASSTGAKEKP